MTCEELKTKVLNGELDDSLLVFVYPDNTFLVNQYINQICKIKDLTPKYLDSIKDVPVDADDFFGTSESTLYVITVDKFVVSVSDLQYTNTIVICKEATNTVDDNNPIVEFPKLTKDQIKEYMEVLCPGLTLNILDWLYDITGGDIYRIEKELLKISIFPDSKQHEVFENIKQEGGYIDLNPLTIYNFINAFMKKDRATICDVLQSLDIIDVEGTGVVTLLTRNIKNVIDIQLNPKASADDLKMSEKQFKAVKYSCGKFSDRKLIEMYRILTNIDYKLKSGRFELNNSQMVDYLVSHLMEAGY